MHLSDAQRRALRTLLQAITGAGVVGFLELFVFPLFPTPPHLSAEQRTMAVAIAGTAIAFIQNFLEDEVGMPALLKAPTSPGANPIPPTTQELEPH